MNTIKSKSKKDFDDHKALEDLKKDPEFIDLYNSRESDSILLEQIKLTLQNAGHKISRDKAKLTFVKWKKKYPLPEIPPKSKTTRPELTPELIEEWRKPKEEKTIANYHVIEIRNKFTEKDQKCTVKFWLDSNRKINRSYLENVSLDIDTLMSEKCYTDLLKQSQTAEVTVYTINDLKNIYEKLKAKQSQFIYFKQEMYHEIVALLSIVTYFIDIFQTVGYIDISAPDIGFGKTQLLEVIVHSSFHGVWDTDITPANIYRRMKHEIPLTMGFDDIDNNYGKNSESGGLTSVIDSGYKRGARVSRINQTTEESTKFVTFGPKLWTRKNKIPQSILSRSLSIPMIKNLGRKDLINRPPTPKDFEEFRDKLYCIRYDIMDKVESVYNNLMDTRKLTGRVAEVFLPVLTVAELIDCDLKEKILHFVTKYKEKRPLNMKSQMKAMMVQVLCENIDLRDKVKGINICTDYNAKLAKEKYLPTNANDTVRNLIAPKIYEILDSLNFELDKGAGGYKYVDIDIEVLEDLARVYGYKNEFEEAEICRKKREIHRMKLREEGLTNEEILNSEQLEVIGSKLQEMTENGEKL